MYRLVGDMIFQSKNHSKSLARSTLVWSWRNIPTSFQFMGLFFPPQRMSQTRLESGLKKNCLQIISQFVVFFYSISSKRFDNSQDQSEPNYRLKVAFIFQPDLTYYPIILPVGTICSWPWVCIYSAKSSAGRAPDCHSDGSKITLLPWPWQYHSRGSKKSSIAQKAQNCQIHSEMEEKIFTATAVVLPRPRKQCNFTSVTMVLPRLYQQMIWRNISGAQKKFGKQ